MNETINQRIFHYRKLAGITQAEAAEQMGMKLSTYSQMERKGKITTEKLVKIAKILNIEPDILLNGPKTTYVPPENLVVDYGEAMSDGNTDNNTGVLPIRSPIIEIPVDTYTPTNRELSTMKMIHNLPKNIQEEIFAFIHQKYEENK